MCVRVCVYVCVCVTDLRVEEDLRAKEALVSHIDGKLFLADGINAGVLLYPFRAVCVVLIKLLHQVRTHVTEALLQEEITNTHTFVLHSILGRTPEIHFPAACQ